MSADNTLLFQRVQESFRKLSVVSTYLNAVSDKLGASASGLDASLKRLNLGISSWVAFSEWQSEDHLQYKSDDVGYTKAGGKWGLAIRSVSGNEAHGNTNEDLWPFNEAPRGLRIRAVAKIPDLLDKLVADATNAAEETAKKAETIDALTLAINAVADPGGMERKQASTPSR